MSHEDKFHCNTTRTILSYQPDENAMNYLSMNKYVLLKVVLAPHTVVCQVSRIMRMWGDSQFSTGIRVDNPPYIKLSTSCMKYRIAIKCWKLV